MIKAIKKKEMPKDRLDKKGADILNLFQELREVGAEEDKLFRKVKSLYETLKDHEKEALFRAIIEKIEVSKEEVVRLSKELSTLDTDDPGWSKSLSELRSGS